MPYPDQVDSFAEVTAGAARTSPRESSLMNAFGRAIEAVQTKLGVGASDIGAAPVGAVLERTAGGSGWSADALDTTIGYATKTLQFDITTDPYNATSGGTAAANTTAIQAALDAAALVGGAVVVPDGDFSHNGLTVAANVAVRGQGRGSILRYTGAGTGIIIDDSCVLDSLVLRGAATPTAGSVGLGFAATAARWGLRDVVIEFFDTGAYIDNAWIGTFDNCIVSECPTYGVHTGATSVNIVRFVGGEIALCGKGAYLTGTNALVFDGTAIEGNTTHGIHVAGTLHGLSVVDSYFEDNGTYDIQVSSHGRAAKIDGNFFLTTPTSLQLDAGRHVTVDNNWFNPAGATPKSLVIGLNAEDVVIGDGNIYLAGAYSSADNAGKRTKQATSAPGTTFIPAVVTAAQNTGYTVLQQNNAYWFASRVASDEAVNRVIAWDAPLAAGTYTFDLFHQKNTNNGIYTVSIDGVDVGTIDGYASALANSKDSITGITVANGGTLRVKLTTATKNASSTAYAGSVSGIALTKTA